MATNPARKLFVNIQVKDLQRSMDFFTRLGFAFNKQFTDEKAACMIVSEDAYFMLLSEPFFRTFTKRQPADTTKETEAMYALSCNSRSTRSTSPAAHASKIDRLAPRATSRFTISFWRW